jgi:hypothetical protein
MPKESLAEQALAAKPVELLRWLEESGPGARPEIAKAELARRVVTKHVWIAALSAVAGIAAALAAWAALIVTLLRRTA